MKRTYLVALILLVCVTACNLVKEPLEEGKVVSVVPTPMRQVEPTSQIQVEATATTENRNVDIRVVTTSPQVESGDCLVDYFRFQMEVAVSASTDSPTTKITPEGVNYINLPLSIRQVGGGYAEVLIEDQNMKFVLEPGQNWFIGLNFSLEDEEGAKNVSAEVPILLYLGPLDSLVDGQAVTTSCIEFPAEGEGLDQQAL